MTKKTTLISIALLLALLFSADAGYIQVSPDSVDAHQEQCTFHKVLDGYLSGAWRYGVGLSFFEFTIWASSAVEKYYSPRMEAAKYASPWQVHFEPAKMETLSALHYFQYIMPETIRLDIDILMDFLFEPWYVNEPAAPNIGEIINFFDKREIIPLEPHIFNHSTNLH